MKQSAPLPSPRALRTLGGLFVVLGLALTVGMGWITSYMARLVSQPLVAGAGARWTGDHAMTVQMFWMFGAVILFGILTVLNGAWILRHGAFSPILRWLQILAGVVLFGVAGLFLLAHGDA